ncbi:MAG TPA: LysM domain-containing protein [Solirubrobacterales bacterium]|nr:LysM domain-containing protein [Solirubrobacterales bacterium]
MQKRTNAAARIAASLALIGAVLLIVVVIGTAMDGDSSQREQRNEKPAKKEKKQRVKAKTYTVETGDTLTAISHKTGVPVAEILALNPEVDPQILIAGQTLKLK